MLFSGQNKNRSGQIREHIEFIDDLVLWVLRIYVALDHGSISNQYPVVGGHDLGCVE